MILANNNNIIIIINTNSKRKEGSRLCTAPIITREAAEREKSGEGKPR